MLKRSIYIGNPTYLKLKQNQMLVVTPDTKEVRGTVPIEDMALLVLDHHQVTVSTQLLDRLMGNTVAVVHCDAHHLPNGLMLPMAGHTELTERWRFIWHKSIPVIRIIWKVKPLTIIGSMC